MVLADLPRIGVEVDELRPRSQRLDPRCLALRQQVGTDGNEQVVFVHHRPQRRGHARHTPGVKRVVGRKGGGVRHAFKVDRSADRLRKRGEFGMCATARHRIAREDHRRQTCGDEVGGGFDSVVIGDDPRADACWLQQVEAARADQRHFAQQVAGDRQEHRPRRLGQCDLGGATHGARQVGEPPDLVAPLDQRSRQRSQIVPQQRLGQRETRVLLPRRHEDRRARLLRVVEHPHRIPQPRRGVEVRHRQLARRLRVAVGHAEHDDLVQSEDIADGARLVRLYHEGVHQRQFGGAGIAEDELDPFRAQQVEEDVLAGGGGHGRVSGGGDELP